MKKKIILGVLALAIVGAIGVWYFVFYRPVHDRYDVTNEKAIVITPASLIAEFTQNEDSANKKYNNKVIELNGELQSILDDSTGSTIVLNTGTPNTSISARSTKKYNVQPNATITVKGLFTGYIMGEIQLSEAIITQGATDKTAAEVKVNPPSLQKTDTAMPPKNVLLNDTPKVGKPAKPVLPTVTAIENFKSTKASIKFFSSTPAEDIEATNTQVLSTLNTEGALNFSALIKGFRFDNELMQEHFNGKDYMNSEVYPKAEFKGTITNAGTIKFGADGSYPATVKGNLTIHGVTNAVTMPATITVTGGKVSAASKFKIKIKDYKVEGGESVASELEITVSANY